MKVYRGMTMPTWTNHERDHTGEWLISVRTGAMVGMRDTRWYLYDYFVFREREQAEAAFDMMDHTHRSLKQIT
jgi:hypothetical protein